MIGGTPPKSAMKFVLYDPLRVASQAKAGLSISCPATRNSIPRFTTAPRFSNWVTFPDPTDGGTVAAINASFVRLL